MLELNWGALIGAMVIRKAAWDKLPQATRQELLQAAQEAGRQNKEHGRAESDRAVTVMQSKGLKVQPTTPEIVAEWQRAVEKIYPQIKGTIVPADIFEEVERILQEYRTSGGTAK
jgi:TRAP-type C4-dicarboxylate transport system substrate-binding protein